MWAILAAIISTVVGFGAGAADLVNKILPQQNAQNPSAQVAGVKACYKPETNVKLTLTWPDNFTNLTDNRKTLNPDLFSSVGTTFNSTADLDNDSYPDCKIMVMNSKTTNSQKPSVERTFIRVRENIRIASCKTDELAGPFGSGVCPDYQGHLAQVTRHRGLCVLSGYTDLRKVAEVDQGGEKLEIFWNPFSYNVGCNFRQDDNCGPGDRRNINLKDFIYVLKVREAFDPLTHPGCPVLWDAGSVNIDACSHYFDVYMAEDLYYALQSAPATTDPHSPYYFLKQVVENCQETSLFVPAADSVFGLPPGFIPKPFINQNQSGISIANKISPVNSIEETNYLGYIWVKPDVIRPDLTNLIRIADSAGPPNICPPYVAKPTPNQLTITPPTKAPPLNCYDPLGTIIFKNEQGNDEPFTAYSMPSTPQTFYLVKEGDQAKIYSYTITEKDYPANTRRDPSLQLRLMHLLSQNQWTWATPWCKPAIYLYPEKPTEVNVKLQLDGKLTESYPPYNEVHGWSVFAYPDGRIATSPFARGPLANRTYAYLYYEADLNNVTIPTQGWVWTRVNLPVQLTSLMQKLGFNQKETEDFLTYWLKRLTDKPYYFVTLLPEQVINEKEKLTFSQNIDSIIRARFVFEGLDVPIFVAPPAKIFPSLRTGFTVTDWGGTLIGKSCSDINIK